MTARCPRCERPDVPLVKRELLWDPGHPFLVLARHTVEETSFVNGDGGLVRETRQVRCNGSFEEVAEALHGAA
jgi:hypothetical protein